MNGETPLDLLADVWREYIINHAAHIMKRAQEGDPEAKKVLDAHFRAFDDVGTSRQGKSILLLEAALRCHDVATHGQTKTCAWCGRVLKEGTPRVISHGICDECAAEQFPADSPLTS
jgi:hypothetical protein